MNKREEGNKAESKSGGTKPFPRLSSSEGWLHRAAVHAQSTLKKIKRKSINIDIKICRQKTELI